MNRDLYINDRYINLDRSDNEYTSEYQKDLITPIMRDKIEELEMFGDKNKLLQRKVYYLEDYRDKRISREIIKGPKGTFYLNSNLIPEGVTVKRAQFSYRMGGPKTASYLGLYLVVEGDLDNPEMIDKEIREFDNVQIASEVYNYLRARLRNVELIGNKIVISDNLYGTNIEINKFLEKYQEKVLGYKEYKQREKFSNVEREVRDDDVFGY